MNLTLSRRQMLQTVSGGFGAIAAQALGATDPSARKMAHHEARAKSVIFVFLDGGLSQVDSFDYKPFLEENHAREVDLPATTFRQSGAPQLIRPLWDFHQRGESGLWVSDLFPHLATCADDITVIRSMTSLFPEHSQACYFLHSGMGIPGFPSMGCWATYGLGTENEDLPGFVVLRGNNVVNGNRNYYSGYLPSKYDPSIWQMGTTPLANLEAAKPDQQDSALSLLRQYNNGLISQRGTTHSELEGSITALEKAFVMQMSVPEVLKIESETEATRRLYGMDQQDKVIAAFGESCLTARRLVERGVRFVQVTMPEGSPPNWDQHRSIVDRHQRNADIIDQGVAGLIQDLKGRGLLDDTLVVIGTEFGRTPFAEDFSNANFGRDHNIGAFSMVMAGGGVKRGYAHGETDEFGSSVVTDEVTMHDFHATLLHLLGLDHEALTFRFGGRDMSLTDVHGHVVKGILA